MWRITSVLLLLTLFGALAGCQCGEVGFIPCSSTADCPPGRVCIAGTCQLTDSSASEGGCPGPVCGPVCCAAGELCRFERCIEAQNPCQSDKGCINDTYCHEGECIPWGLGPGGDRNEACTHLVPIGLFAPAVQCAWTAPPPGDAHPAHTNVLGTPVVVDFDTDGDPKTHKPSVAFVSYSGLDGGGQAARCDGGFFGVIRVIDGETCAQSHSVALAQVRAAAPLAAGDLNLDGRPELVAARCGGGLVAFAYDPAKKAFRVEWTSSPATTGAAATMWDGPSIHDLDDDGKPEVLLSGTVWSNSGALRDGALGILAVGAGLIPVAADLDGDGVVEFSDGASIWAWQGGTWSLRTSVAANQPGQVAVADFGRYGADPAQDDRGTRDGLAEIVVVAQGTVRLQTLAGRVVFGPVAIPSGGAGGPPTVGDFDNDGRAEVAAAGSDSYSVFDPDCRGTPDKATCDSQTTSGVLWTRVSQDHSSNVTGSSIFDFEGDGRAEAIYADECFTRVYDGKNGEVLFSQYRSSCTWYENPIVADVDGDFRSELVVPANANCNISPACETNPNHEHHPVSQLTLDPLFRGLRCQGGEDCLSTQCDQGFCRCTDDNQCGGGGFVCGPPVAGTPGQGQVCRSAFLGQKAGITVYRDVLDRWVSSRMIWNQHAYAVTNVNDDGSIPKTSAWTRNWTQPGLNNFRQNVQGTLDPTASPDLTAQPGPEVRCSTDGTMTLQVKLCNRGTKPIGPGTSVAFYDGAPKDRLVLCTAQNQSQIDPGACEEVSCSWPGALQAGEKTITAVADDDGTGKGGTAECEEGNNLAIFRARCQDIQ